MSKSTTMPIFGIPGEKDQADIRAVLEHVLHNLRVRNNIRVDKEYGAFKLYESIQELGYTQGEAADLGDMLQRLSWVIRMPRKENGAWIYYVDPGVGDLISSFPAGIFEVTYRKVIARRKLAAEIRSLRRKLAALQ